MDPASNQSDCQASRLTAEQSEILERLAELSKVFPVGELLAAERRNEHIVRLEAMMLYPFQFALGENELAAIRAATDALRAQVAAQSIRKPR